MDSSLTIYSSLEIAAMERAEMDETMAVLEINELPGRASIND